MPCVAPGGRGADTPRMQRRRILQRLKHGPAALAELRHECGVSLALQRVNELRELFDWPIEPERFDPAAGADGEHASAIRYRLDPDAARYVDALRCDSFADALFRAAAA